MAAKKKAPEAGSVTWFDLTVKDARKARDFYRRVAGWKAAGHPMGEYEDYVMTLPASGKVVAGICHARGPNRGIPAQWMLYITVKDLDRALAAARRAGGRLVHGPRAMGGRMAVVRDPAGAVCALFEHAK